MGNLPDWLSLLVAVASLAGGAAGGVYAGALARSRLDDRRRLLWLLRFQAPGTEPQFPRGVWNRTEPPGIREISSWVRSGPHSDYGVRLGEKLPIGLVDELYAKESARECAVTCALLPWVDRAMLVRYFDTRFAASTELAGLQVITRKIGVIVQLVGAVEPIWLDDWKAVRAEAQSLDSGSKVAYELLVGYLTDMTNPTIVSRFRLQARKVTLLATGPRPWSRRIDARELAKGFVVDQATEDAAHDFLRSLPALKNRGWLHRQGAATD